MPPKKDCFDEERSTWLYVTLGPLPTLSFRIQGSLPACVLIIYYRCLGGSKGDNCEQPAQVCETLDHVTLCVNNGECNNTKGSAICECSLGEL